MANPDLGLTDASNFDDWVWKGVIDSCPTGGSLTTILSNASSSNVLYRVTHLSVSNQSDFDDASDLNSVSLSTALNNGSNRYLTVELEIKGGVTHTIINRDSPLYIEPGQQLRLTNLNGPGSGAVGYTTNTSFAVTVVGSFTSASPLTITNTNQGNHNTTATLRVYPSAATTVTYSATISSETNFDFGRLYHYSSSNVLLATLYNLSGTQSPAGTVATAAGDYLLYNYRKDGSVNSGTDTHVCNLYGGAGGGGKGTYALCYEEIGS